MKLNEEMIKELDRVQRIFNLSAAQVARYAASQGLAVAALAMFVPVADEAVLAQLSGDEIVDGVRVVTVAIGWT